MVTVIGAGLPRTGTTSMKAALDRLGFGPCHHMFEIIAHPEQVDRWLPLAYGKPVDWDAVLAGYNATHDWPSGFFWRELAGAYPEAKVVLTVRDPDRWAISFKTLMRNGAAAVDPDGVPENAAPMFRGMQRMRPLLDRMRNETFDLESGRAEDMPDAVAVAGYQRHIERVRAGLPPERLLVFDVREGWEPLCGFLGVDVPDEPFPHLNDTDFLKQAMADMAAGGDFPDLFTPGQTST
ncbi:sulfotransferase family protein [Actinomadura barringtoniae]|uniref:Sulfotransferase family protein n=1 Tax=Actinomadura barringtoniae TaxID=1427535 RepID=A0A939PIH3_9ACTN|nr:sulfotransferase family protein [Actinomadura barringtoniae]MBO2453050.1 sulfotransferase family protein [Actinomadura barringtoniae]